MPTSSVALFPATHPDWEALLRAVVANPCDDVARLVAADWLEEHLGDLPDVPGLVGVWERRAELIRVQCELANTPEPAAPLLAREERLLGSWSTDRVLWAAEACPQLMLLRFPYLSLLGGSGVGFRRGFAEVITCTVTDWVAHGPAVRCRQPVREIHLLRVNRLPAAVWWEVLPLISDLDRVLAVDADEITTGFLAEHLPAALRPH